MEKMLERKQISRLLTKLKKANRKTKTNIWNEAFPLRSAESELAVQEMILSLPGQYQYRASQPGYGVDIVDAVAEYYGWMPAMLVSERMLRGLASTHPQMIYVTFTLGLNMIEVF